MPQSPTLATGATPSVPITGVSIGVDPAVTLIPGDPTEVEASLAALQAEIDAFTPGVPATTVTDETTFGITPAVGTDTEYARQDHTHGSPDNPLTGAALAALGVVGAILITDSPAGTPLVFADLLQNDAGTDLLYADI